MSVPSHAKYYALIIKKARANDPNDRKDQDRWGWVRGVLNFSDPMSIVWKQCLQLYHHQSLEWFAAMKMIVTIIGCG